MHEAGDAGVRVTVQGDLPTTAVCTYLESTAVLGTSLQKDRQHLPKDTHTHSRFEVGAHTCRSAT